MGRPRVGRAVGDEPAALELFAKLADHRVSFTDCVSFALMGRHRVGSAFTFDRHFAAAGFATWPRRPAPDRLRQAPGPALSSGAFLNIIAATSMKPPTFDPPACRR